MSKKLIIILGSFVLLGFTPMSKGQDIHTKVHPFSKVAKVTIEKFEWMYPEPSGQTASAALTISNQSDLAITSVKIKLTAVNKAGVMLQSQAATINTLVRKDSIPSEDTQTIVFDHAFYNPDIHELKLQEVWIQYNNGSLEILK